jgi:hypothetical protein
MVPSRMPGSAGGWFARLTPLRGGFILRRLLVELRGIRRALERQADALEASGGTTGIESRPNSFRSFSRTKEELTERDLKSMTEVSYVDERLLGEMLDREAELKAVLGRDPTEQEMERAYRGEVE